MKPTTSFVAPAILAVLCCFVSLTHADESMLINGGMEDARPDALPPGWRPHIVGSPATLTTDTAEKHGGKSSVRIDAGDFTRSYVRSDEMPVVPGEEIHGSAWVKVRDVPPDHGTVIMIAEFVDPSGQDPTVEKFNVADVKKAGWQKIEGSVKVPNNAVSLRLRLGFSYAKGTCWWDDVTITPKTPLAARLDLAEPRLSPAMSSVPVLIVNRKGSNDRVRVKVALNKQAAEQEVTLDGKPTQRIDVAIKIPTPGKVAANVTLLPRRGDKPLFSAEAAAQVPFAIVFPPVSPTHWVIEDGPAKIEGRIDLAVADAEREKAILKAEVRDLAGKVIADWTSDAKPVPDGISSFAIDAKGVGEGDYTIVASLLAPDGKPLTATQPWHVIKRQQAKVTINADGFPVHGGKAFFPLGIFNGAKFKEQADAGFTVTHAYNAARITPGPRPQDDAAKKYLDSTHENGMKMVLMVPMRMAIAGDWDGIRRRVRMFRNHPGLLAWDEEEGYGRGDFKPDTLPKLRQLLQEEDPHHPFLVGDCRAVGVVRNEDRANFFPVDLMDMGMWWWYPFPLKARAANALEGEDATTGTELKLPTFLTAATTSKPIWLGMQSYKKKDSRYPTPQEYRCQAYFGLTGGAKGLMWYGGSVTGGLYLSPEEGRFDALKKVVRELHDLSPELMGKTLEAPAVGPAGNPISVLLKQSPGRIVLIAVNRSTQAIDATLSSPLIKAGKAKRIYEDGAVSDGDGQIKDHFPAYGVHVYELMP